MPAGSTVVTGDGFALTIVSATFNATAAVMNRNRFNDPPADGNIFTIARVRVQNVGGDANTEMNVSNYRFNLVGSSSVRFSQSEHGCGVIPNELNLSLFLGGTGEGNVCFEIPKSETDLILFYQEPRSWSSLGQTSRKWMMVANPASVEAVRVGDVSLEPSPGREIGYFRTNPIPPGMAVESGDGFAFTVVSATFNATAAVMNRNRFNDPPADGNIFTIARVRVQNVGGDANTEMNVSNYRFNLVGSSSVRFSQSEHGCGVIPDELNLSLFLRGTGEGNVCFEIPQSETDLILIYEPRFSDAADRRWMKLP